MGQNITAVRITHPADPRQRQGENCSFSSTQHSPTLLNLPKSTPILTMNLEGGGVLQRGGGEAGHGGTAGHLGPVVLQPGPQSQHTEQYCSIIVSLHKTCINIGISPDGDVSLYGGAGGGQAGGPGGGAAPSNAWGGSRPLHLAAQLPRPPRRQRPAPHSYRARSNCSCNYRSSVALVRLHITQPTNKSRFRASGSLDFLIMKVTVDLINMMRIS